MTTSTIVQRIARVAIGVVAASLIVGQATPAFADAGPTGNSWDTAIAVFTGTDGKQTTVRANSVETCSSTGTMTLSESQQIPFGKMRRFEVTGSDNPSQKADLAVTTLDGQTLTGTVPSYCEFYGKNELGRFGLLPEKLKSVEFLRTGEPTPTGPASADQGQPEPRKDADIKVKARFGERKTECRITVNPQAQRPAVAHCTAPH